MSNKKAGDPRRYRGLMRPVHSIARQDEVAFPVTVGDYPCSELFKPSRVTAQLDVATESNLQATDFET